ncbi:MAG TPA: 50S ribosomal protein L10 [Polyangiaceae bacterium]|jgi:large subunit ribosomal protein L10
MLRTQKEQLVQELRERVERMSSAVIVDYKGMTVEEAVRLRQAFRQRGVVYQVAKNTLVKQALSGASWASGLSGSLKGMTAVAFSFEEPSAAARVLKEFRAQTQKPAVKAGVLDGIVLDASAVENQLASLPSKDEARAQLLAQMLAPAQTLVRLLNTPAQTLLGVVEAKRRKESE